MPHRSDVIPLRNRSIVAPPSWRVKIYPNTFPSYASSVFSDTYENIAGNERNEVIPSNIIMIIRTKIFVNIVRDMWRYDGFERCHVKPTLAKMPDKTNFMELFCLIDFVD